jgi:hypothetical protein
MQEESTMEEYDTSDEDEDDMRCQKPPPEDEKTLLRQEFISQMYHSFLEGKDADFDYTYVIHFYSKEFNAGLD